MTTPNGPLLQGRSRLAMQALGPLVGEAVSNRSRPSWPAEEEAQRGCSVLQLLGCMLAKAEMNHSQHVATCQRQNGPRPALSQPQECFCEGTGVTVTGGAHTSCSLLYTLHTT